MPRITPASPLLAASLSLLTILVPAVAQSQGLRLDDVFNSGDEFHLGLVHRSRLENIVYNVQPGTSRNDQVLVFRTLLDLQYQTPGFTSQLELADMRQQLADSDSVISTATVNSLDVLQATVGVRLGEQRNTWIRLGRFTEDWGSRRLMARNRFRNTINAWDGLVLHHALPGGTLRAMATEVVNRYPSTRQALLDNTRQADKSFDARRFYGIHLESDEFIGEWTSEVYVYLLREKDTAELQTANRRLDTLGFRLQSPRQQGEWDVDVETIVQTGRQRGSASVLDVTDLDHNAYFQYLGLGYSFRSPINLRVMFEFDYASGDAEPGDNKSGRFDSLFGPTTFEFGVVGLYNPFNRSNLVTPGINVSADPWPRINLMAFYRHFWLAEAKDSWGRTGLRDVSGMTDRYLGEHLQLRLRWNALPGNLQVESGAIFLNAENHSDKNSEYFYAGFTLTL